MSLDKKSLLSPLFTIPALILSAATGLAFVADKALFFRYSIPFVILTAILSIAIRRYRSGVKSFWLSFVLPLLICATAILIFSSDRQVALRFLFLSLLSWVVLAVPLSMIEGRLRLKSFLAALLGLAFAIGAIQIFERPLMKIVFNEPFEIGSEILPTPSADEDTEYLNKDGLAFTVPPDRFKPEDFNIIFLGDSFTVGYRPPEQGNPPVLQDSFPKLVEAELAQNRPDLRVRAANFGFSGSSPLLQLRQLERIGAKYKPDLVLQFFDMTDFWEDLSFNRNAIREGRMAPRMPGIFRSMEIFFSRQLFGLPSYRQWLDQQIFRNADSLGDDPPAQRFFAMLHPLAETEKHLDLTWSTIERTKREADRLGARYALFILPRYQQYNPDECPHDWEAKELPEQGAYLMEPFVYFEKKAKSADFPIFSLLDDFKAADNGPLCFSFDPHWNKQGHAIAAKAILAGLADSGLVPFPMP